MLPVDNYSNDFFRNVGGWGLCQKHWREASDKPMSMGKIGHSILALAESLPGLSQIISLIEWVVARVWIALFGSTSPPAHKEPAPPKITPTFTQVATSLAVAAEKAEEYAKKIADEITSRPPVSTTGSPTDTHNCFIAGVMQLLMRDPDFIKGILGNDCTAFKPLRAFIERYHKAQGTKDLVDGLGALRAIDAEKFGAPGPEAPEGDPREFLESLATYVVLGMPGWLHIAFNFYTTTDDTDDYASFFKEGPTVPAIFPCTFSQEEGALDLPITPLPSTIFSQKLFDFIKYVDPSQAVVSGLGHHIKQQPYHLVGFMVHTTDARGPHYSAYLQTAPDTFYHVDDQATKKVRSITKADFDAAAGRATYFMYRISTPSPTASP